VLEAGFAKKNLGARRIKFRSTGVWSLDWRRHLVTMNKNYCSKKDVWSIEISAWDYEIGERRTGVGVVGAAVKRCVASTEPFPMVNEDDAWKFIFGS